MTDLMTRLRDADPTADRPDAPPLEWFRARMPVDDEPVRVRSPRPRRLLAPALAVGVAALVGGLVLAPNGSSPDVVAEAQEALGPAGGIVHYVIRRPGNKPDVQRVEAWVSREPRRERIQVGDDGLTFRSEYADGEIRHVFRGDDHVTVNRMTPEFRREFEAEEPSPLGTGLDPLTGVRRMLEEGKLHEQGETEIDGRRVIELTGTEPGGPAPGGATRPTLDREYYVDADTFAPVRLIERWHQEHGAGTTDFELYERLPLTPENARMLKLPGIDGLPEVDPNAPTGR